MFLAPEIIICIILLKKIKSDQVEQCNSSTSRVALRKVGERDNRGRIRFDIQRPLSIVRVFVCIDMSQAW